MNAWKKIFAVLALGVGTMFVGLGSADAQYGYRSGYGGYYGGGYRSYSPYGSYYGSPYGYRNYGYRNGYRSYNNYRPYGNYYGGGSGVYVTPGGIGIRF